jgi:hypothetical protein
MKTPKVKNHNKNHRASAAQFFVAAELCRRGYAAVVTMGNCPNTDVLCSDEAGTKFVHIQVKTFRPEDKDCAVGQKAERNYGPNFFWVLAGIPTMSSKRGFSYYIIPSATMAKNVSESHEKWFQTPGKKGQHHSVTSFRTVQIPPRVSENGWSVGPYLDKWELIADKLA